MKKFLMQKMAADPSLRNDLELQRIVQESLVIFEKKRSLSIQPIKNPRSLKPLPNDNLNLNNVPKEEEDSNEIAKLIQEKIENLNFPVDPEKQKILNTIFHYKNKKTATETNDVFENQFKNDDSDDEQIILETEMFPKSILKKELKPKAKEDKNSVRFGNNVMFVFDSKNPVTSKHKVINSKKHSKWNGKRKHKASKKNDTTEKNRLLPKKKVKQEKKNSQKKNTVIPPKNTDEANVEEKPAAKPVLAKTGNKDDNKEDVNGNEDKEKADDINSNAVCLEDGIIETEEKYELKIPKKTYSKNYYKRKSQPKQDNDELKKKTVKISASKEDLSHIRSKQVKTLQKKHSGEAPIPESTKAKVAPFFDPHQNLGYFSRMNNNVNNHKLTTEILATLTLFENCEPEQCRTHLKEIERAVAFDTIKQPFVNEWICHLKSFYSVK